MEDADPKRKLVYKYECLEMVSMVEEINLFVDQNRRCYVHWFVFSSIILSAFKDRFTLEEPTEEEMKLENKYKYYRILIIPTPRYTQAAQNVLEKKELTADKTGELIEGNQLNSCSNIVWL